MNIFSSIGARLFVLLVVIGTASVARREGLEISISELMTGQA